jgi:hypothetical protein
MAMRRWLCFTTRELLLLVVAAAGLLAWRADHSELSKLRASHYQIQAAHQELKAERDQIQLALQRQEAEPIAVMARQECEHYRRRLRDFDHLFADILKTLMYEGIHLDLSTPGEIGVSRNPEIDEIRCRERPQVAGETNFK